MTPGPGGVARYVGSVPHDPGSGWHVLEIGDAQLYRVDPPLHGCHVVAAVQMMWAVRARVVGDDSPPEDHVSTHFYPVGGSESVRIDRSRPLDTVDGRNPVRAFGELGYAVR